MPALGLLLEYPIFDMYNKKITAANEKLSGPEDAEWRPPIDFEVHRAQIDEFKENVIYTNMRAIEEREGMYVYPFAAYQNESYFYTSGLTHGHVTLTSMKEMICSTSIQKASSPPKQ
jgi:hypothetical protein